ncbi:hypothetical protein B5X24_HaOG205342 [Helicoverpa armigera]|uniref:Uncharacterized protein n=1 Tax=Helicoverpa armigera TaxID=29058 RepID=A0A2W1BT00_HELAM|nr:hypothetical protein B5X24_HaOG205342 [Helicoverpa armigera]
MSTEMDTSAGTSSLKRKRNDIIVDPDTRQEVQDPKRPRMTLDGDKKVKCLTALYKAYLKIIDALANIMFGSLANSDKAAYAMRKEELKGVSTNMQAKVGSTDYNIHFMGNDYSIKRSDIDAIWIIVTKAQGLEYKNFLFGHVCGI